MTADTTNTLAPLTEADEERAALLEEWLRDCWALLQTLAESDPNATNRVMMSVKADQLREVLAADVPHPAPREARLWEALAWIDTFSPEDIAAAEDHFGINVQNRAFLSPALALIGGSHGNV